MELFSDNKCVIGAASSVFVPKQNSASYQASGGLGWTGAAATCQLQRAARNTTRQAVTRHIGARLRSAAL